MQYEKISTTDPSSCVMASLKRGVLCMKGGIYSDERCPVCDGHYRDYGNALSCPEHPKCKASNHKVIFGNVTKRFKSYQEATRFLTDSDLKPMKILSMSAIIVKITPLDFPIYQASGFSTGWMR